MTTKTELRHLLEMAARACGARSRLRQQPPRWRRRVFDERIA